MASVLIAESEGDIRAPVRLLLEDAGYMVVEARDAPETLRLLQERVEPLVVVLSHFWRGTNSAVVLQAIDVDPRIERHGFIFVTTTPELLPSALALLLVGHAIPVLGKPYDFDALLAAIRRAETRLTAATVHVPHLPPTPEHDAEREAN